MTANPLDGPFLSAPRLLNYSDDSEYAIPPACLPAGSHPDAVAWTLARLDRLKQQD